MREFKAGIQLCDHHVVVSVQGFGEIEHESHDFVLETQSISHKDTWFISDSEDVGAAKKINDRLLENKILQSQGPVKLVSALAGSKIEEAGSLRGTPMSEREVLKYFGVLLAHTKKKVEAKINGTIAKAVLCAPSSLVAATSEKIALDDGGEFVHFKHYRPGNNRGLELLKLAAHAAGYPSVDVKWSSDLLANKMVSSDAAAERIPGNKADEYRGVFIVEVGLKGIFIVPYSIKKKTLEVQRNRPLVYIPFALFDWLKSNVENPKLSADLANKFNRLSDAQKNTFMNCVFFESGFVGSKTGKQKIELEELELNKMSVDLVYDLSDELGISLLANVYSKEISDIGELPRPKDGYHEMVSEDDLDSFLRNFDIDQDGERIKSNWFQLDGSIASNPILKQPIQRAISLLLWRRGSSEPIGGVENGSDDDGVLTCANIAVAELGNQVNDTLPGEYWKSIGMKLEGMGIQGGDESVGPIGEAAKRPALLRCIEPEIARNVNKGEPIVCSVSATTVNNDEIELRFGIELSEIHIGAALETEIYVDRDESIKLSILVDGCPYPAVVKDIKSVSTKEKAVSVPAPLAVGLFTCFASADHKSFCELREHLSTANGRTLIFTEKF